MLVEFKIYVLLCGGGKIIDIEFERSLASEDVFF